MNAPIPIKAPRMAGTVVSIAAKRAKSSKRLTESEADDLRYLWTSYSADLGIRSVHGMIERHMILRAPPRDVRQPVLEELARAGGRAPEGRVIRLVVLEGLATAHEARLAIRVLARPGGRKGPRIERLAVPRPEVSPLARERSYAEQARLDEWTGFDLRMTERGELTMRLALDAPPPTLDDYPTTHGERSRRKWAALDASIEAEWRTMALRESHPYPSYGEDMLGSRQRRKVERATETLSRMTAFDARVLFEVCGEYHATEDDELEAVRRLVGGNRKAAEEARDKACEAYRNARRRGSGLKLVMTERKKAKAGSPTVRVFDGAGWKELEEG